MSGTVSEHLDGLTADQLKEVIIHACHSDRSLRTATTVKNATRTIKARQQPSTETTAEQASPENEAPKGPSKADMSQTMPKSTGIGRSLPSASHPPPAHHDHQGKSGEWEGCRYCGNKYLPSENTPSSCTSHKGQPKFTSNHKFPSTKSEISGRSVAAAPAGVWSCCGTSLRFGKGCTLREHAPVSSLKAGEFAVVPIAPGGFITTSIEPTSVTELTDDQERLAQQATQAALRRVGL